MKPIALCCFFPHFGPRTSHRRSSRSDQISPSFYSANSQYVAAYFLLFQTEETERLLSLSPCSCECTARGGVLVVRELWRLRFLTASHQPPTFSRRNWPGWLLARILRLFYFYYFLMRLTPRAPRHPGWADMTCTFRLHLAQEMWRRAL